MSFKNYLKTVRKKSGSPMAKSSQDKYFNVIEKIFEKKHGVIPTDMSLSKLKELLERVKKEQYDIKGNRMYSVALNHYVKYKENCIELSQDSNDTEENELVSGVEGKPKLRYVATYERDPKLREEAIRIHGCICKVCGFDFSEAYGELGKGYIQIHHKIPISELEAPKEVIPKTDLVPLCSNCHSMIHRRKTNTLKVGELKELMESNKIRST